MHYADNEMWGQGSLVVGLFTVGSAQLKIHKHVLLLTLRSTEFAACCAWTHLLPVVHGDYVERMRGWLDYGRSGVEFCA